MAQDFENTYNDYETASYFYKRCLDVSIDNKKDKGQAEAYKGLGICEERVLNTFKAQQYLETAQEQALTANDRKLETEISKDLVRVYQTIATDY